MVSSNSKASLKHHFPVQVFSERSKMSGSILKKPVLLLEEGESQKSQALEIIAAIVSQHSFEILRVSE